MHVTRTLAQSREVGLIVVAAPPDEVDGVQQPLASEHDGIDLLVVAGGATRHESVRRALAMVPDRFEFVLVHDAARPLVPVALVDLVAQTVGGGADAAVPGTRKRVSVG